MDKGNPTTPNIPPPESEHHCWGGGVSSVFCWAVVSPFEALAGARRLLDPREPADGLQRAARPPRWPRPLASSFSPASYPSKSSRRAAPDPVGLVPGAKLSGEEKGAESEERGRAKSTATPGLFRQA